MLFLPSRLKPQDEGSAPDGGVLSRSARVIIDLLDVVGNIRDGAHLQCVAFLAQELGLLTEPCFLFAAPRPEPRRPHSLLLEGHFYNLLREGIVDVSGAGYLRVRRDLQAVPSSGLASRRLSALGALSPHEARVFAAAVLHLAGEGRYAGSVRHDGVFQDAVASLAASDPDDEPSYDGPAAGHEHESHASEPVPAPTIDERVLKVCTARQCLLPMTPVMLTPL